MSKFDEFIDAVVDGAKALAEAELGGFQDAAKDDALAFIEKLRADLERWTKLLAKGDLTERDFSDLVQAKRALAEIHALTQTGIALARVERLRVGLIDIVISSAFSVFL